MRRPLAAMFFDKSKRLEQSWLRVTKETFLPSDTEISPLVSDKKSFKTFLYRYTRKISPAPWRQGFLMNHDNLNNLGSESTRKHFCQVIMKSVLWFLTKIFILKFSI